MSDLLDPTTNQWNTELIRSIFYAPDAAAILAMARPRVGGADVWAWAREKSGLFTVRSAYRHEMETKSQVTETSGSSSGHLEGIVQNQCAPQDPGVLVARAKEFFAVLWRASEEAYKAPTELPDVWT